MLEPKRKLGLRAVKPGEVPELAARAPIAPATLPFKPTPKRAGEWVSTSRGLVQIRGEDNG